MTKRKYESELIVEKQIINKKPVFTWCVTGKNGLVIAFSKQKYANKRNAIKGAESFLEGIKKVKDIMYNDLVRKTNEI